MSNIVTLQKFGDRVEVHSGDLVIYIDGPQHEYDFIEEVRVKVSTINHEHPGTYHILGEFRFPSSIPNKG